ncbi:MAG: hypothetical protein SW833_24380 [Cyanobacteriota bacterium]|nr:hypothetical protein [Cyanobacteriota bacterium]
MIAYSRNASQLQQSPKSEDGIIFNLDRRTRNLSGSIERYCDRANPNGIPPSSLGNPTSATQCVLHCQFCRELKVNCNTERKAILPEDQSANA